MSKINWLTIEDLNNSELFKSNCVIFKHSPRCIISKIVLKKFEFQHSDKCGIDKFFLINVIKEREISNQISTLFQLNHESPQLLLVKNKSLIYSASHSDINFKDLL
ncbi:MAG: bacillithiol system redox-active protein YtxJ [Flavobacteriaceae bacterium]|jgi:bacillithiol system protein YtxJ|nr:bacillithiol system redox-active protein YtxJ [Flavobacteriaceae bacterium]RZP06366.1 MAG: bacillithiol system redox-active protein YtxJ [Flavobacteriales bacterium]